MKVLFVGAHPDDIEYGCSGTIAILEKRGYEVDFLIMSDGENDLSHESRNRLNEQEKAAEKLHINSVHYLKCKDGFINDDAETINKVSEMLSIIRPDLVITHYYDDRHQDHRKTSWCVRSACWGKVNLMYFQSFSSMNFEPNVYVDISIGIAQKREVLNCYSSQITKYKERHIDFVNGAISSDIKNGGNIHCSYAEGFILANFVWKIV